MGYKAVYASLYAIFLLVSVSLGMYFKMRPGILKHCALSTVYCYLGSFNVVLKITNLLCYISALYLLFTGQGFRLDVAWLLMSISPYAYACVGIGLAMAFSVAGAAW